MIAKAVIMPRIIIGLPSQHIKVATKPQAVAAEKAVMNHREMTVSTPEIR